MKQIFFLVTLLVSACAAGPKHEFRASPGPSPNHRRTVVLFVVDGFAATTLREGLRRHSVPNLRRFFLRGADRFPVGQAEFPTLTYPNLTSILTTRPVGEHPVTGNLVLAPGGKVVAYDDPANFRRLRATVDPLSVITALNQEGRETVSFSYVFGRNAGGHMRVGLREALDYDDENYEKLDGRLIDNLTALLAERGGPARWPELVYVHLVGVDSLSHQYGPNSREVARYLRWLDARLGAPLALLEAGEKQGSVMTFLTADHGFAPVKRYAKAAQQVRKADAGVVVLNEGRFLALHAGKSGPASLAPVLAKVRAIRGVELTALRVANVLEITWGEARYRFAIGAPVCEESPVSLAPVKGNVVPAASFRCPTAYDDRNGELPFLVAQLARYFAAPGHPDALVLAGNGVSFSKGGRGSHGGATAGETLVPVLLRGAALDGGTVVHTRELLKVLVPRPAL